MAGKADESERAGGASPLEIRIEGRIAHLTLQRPARRNALDDRLMAALHGFFERPPPEVRAAILAGAGGHFSAGLDLAEHAGRAAAEGCTTRASGTA